MVAPPSKLSQGTDNCKHKKIGSRLVERPYLGAYCTEHGTRMYLFVLIACVNMRYRTLQTPVPCLTDGFWDAYCGT